MRKVWSVVAAAVLAVALMVFGVAWWLGPDDKGDDAALPDAGEPGIELVQEPRPLKVAKSKVLRRDPTYVDCNRPTGETFVPVSISVEHVTRHATVLALPRDSRGVPGVPPVSTTGKNQFAFDAPGIMPGEPAGNVLMNAHTWPDGTAMGNRLLQSWQEGDQLVLRGPGKQFLCYEVTERLEVPVHDAPLERVYATSGPPQLVMIVCSGTRLGPGNWSHRMLWFASPIGG